MCSDCKGEKMTATDELRRMLDERGVEHVDADDGHTQHTWWSDGDHEIAASNSGERLAVYNLTPEQAIDATLGSCNCSNSERAGTCRLEGFADVPFSVDYEIEGYDMGSSRDYATLAECSSCGAYVILPPEYHHVLTCDGDEAYQPYRFCPNCGRRVVDE